MIAQVVIFEEEHQPLLLDYPRAFKRRNTSVNFEAEDKKTRRWSKCAKRCVEASTISNLGIILDNIRNFISSFLKIPGLDVIALGFELLIYGFKAAYHIFLITHVTFFKRDLWKLELLQQDSLEDLKLGKIYIQLAENKIHYQVAGLTETAEITAEELKHPIPRSQEELLQLKEKILAITTRRGHTSQFELECRKLGHHKYQLLGDIICFGLFVLTILALSHVLFGPYGAIIGWTTGLIGVGINVYFDYAYQAKLAKKRKDYLLEELQKNTDPTIFQKLQMEFRQAIEDYEEKRDAKRLYIALLIGLVLLCICGSIAAIVPPALLPFFLTLKYFGTAMIFLINIGRFLNWWKPQLKQNFYAFFGVRLRKAEVEKFLQPQNYAEYNASLNKMPPDEAQLDIDQYDLLLSPRD